MSEQVVLLVGEGRDDVGHDSDDRWIGEGGVPRGFLEPLLRRVLPGIQWHRKRVAQLPSNPGRPRGGHLKGKARDAWRAYVLARTRRMGGLVFVIDRDRRADRPAEVERGIARAQADLGAASLAVAWGVAQETIDAWMLGDRVAWGTAFDMEPPTYPCPRVEDLWGRYEEPSSNHPKRVKERILSTVGRRPDRYQETLAEHVDPGRLAVACPVSFAPFLERVKACMGGAAPSPARAPGSTD